MKKDITKEHIIAYRIDSKLRDQVVRYAKRNDDSVVSRTARRALEWFLEEDSMKNNKK